MAGGINIASLFATIGADTSGLQSGLGKAKTSLESFGGSMLKQIAGVVSLTAAIGAAGKFISSSVTDWADYADSMRLSAQTAGITTEEMSRLAQAADDFRVPIGTMQKSMEMALKNGFVPTIANIAALSDELLKISDPAGRAAVASKIFGKSYADMMPFLLAGGDAIRNGTAAIDDSLVVTAQGAAQAKEYKDQVDEIGDTWTGVKNQVGQAVLPSISNVLNQMISSGDISGMRRMVTTNLKELVKVGKITGDEYDAAMMKVSTRNMTVADTMEMLTGMAQDTSGQLQEVAAGQAAYAQAMSGASTSLSGVAGAADDAAASEANLNAEAAAQAAIAEAAAAAWDEYVAAVRDITSLDANFGSIISLAKNYDGVLKEITAQEAIMAAEPTGSEKWLEAKKNIDDLKKSMTDMANQMTLDMLQATIAIDGITSKEAASYFQMAADMGLISEEAAAAAIAAYGNAVETINGYAFEDKELTMTSNAAEIWSTLEMIDALILADKNMNINITKTYYGSGGLEGQDPYENWGGATGGYISKGGLINVGEHGKELVYLPDHAQIIPHSRTNETIDALTNGQSTVINNYNLTMPTTANAGDIRTAFELMEAWA
jgi:hypothetical protein